MYGGCVLYVGLVHARMVGVSLPSGLVRLIVSITNGGPMKVAHTFHRVRFNFFDPGWIF